MLKNILTYVKQIYFKSKSESCVQIKIVYRPVTPTTYLMRGWVCHFSGSVSNMSVVSMYIIFTFYMLLHGITVHMYIQYIQNLCQSRLNIVDHALSLVANATMVVLSLEWSYVWPLLSLSLLYFLCCALPCPILLTFAFSWFHMTFACCLHNFVI
jgi:hypothetical protein